MQNGTSYMGCGDCGAYGTYEQIGSWYDPEKPAQWRRWKVTHRTGDSHVFESTNLPIDDERYEVRSIR